MSKDYNQVFNDYLEGKQQRYTSQRKRIVAAIADQSHHFEVDEFIAAVRDTHEPFSRATVYRTIKQLFDAGLLQKVQTLDGKVFYEHKFFEKHHDHIICNQCGKIIEFNNQDIDQLLSSVCNTMLFAPDYRSLHIYGSCKKFQDTGQVCDPTKA